MATARDSVIYSNAEVNHYLQDARVAGGRCVPQQFGFTVLSAAATGDTYNLFRLPANWAVAFLFATTDGLGGTATLKIGDAGDDARLMVATDFSGAEAQGFLAAAGVGYSPSVDTVIFATITNAPTVGQTVSGYVILIPAT